MSIIAKLATDQAIADHLTADQLNHAIGYARKMANVTTDIDRFQWLAIQAALEVMTPLSPSLRDGERAIAQPERITQCPTTTANCRPMPPNWPKPPPGA